MPIRRVRGRRQEDWMSKKWLDGRVVMGDGRFEIEMEGWGVPIIFWKTLHEPNHDLQKGGNQLLPLFNIILNPWSHETCNFDQQMLLSLTQLSFNNNKCLAPHLGFPSRKYSHGSWESPGIPFACSQRSSNNHNETRSSLKIVNRQKLSQNCCLRTNAKQPGLSPHLVEPKIPQT